MSCGRRTDVRSGLPVYDELCNEVQARGNHLEIHMDGNRMILVIRDGRSNALRAKTTVADCDFEGAASRLKGKL
jgi:hypothetical protein